MSCAQDEYVRLNVSHADHRDLGMRKLPHAAAEDLVEIIMRRYERASTLLMSSVPLPELVRVTVCGRLSVPIGWSPKFTLVVERVTCGNAARNPYAMMFPIKGLL